MVPMAPSRTRMRSLAAEVMDARMCSNARRKSGLNPCGFRGLIFPQIELESDLAPALITRVAKTSSGRSLRLSR